MLILCEDEEVFFYPLKLMENENGTAVFQSAVSVAPEYPKILK